jgi:microcystin-dependent protein
MLLNAANSIPTGYLEADGSSLDTTTYADLFAVIGYTFGGSGSSFNLPDLRGQFLRGFDNGKGLDDGRVLFSEQDDQLQGHVHFVNYGLTNFNNNGWTPSYTGTKELQQFIRFFEGSSVATRGTWTPKFDPAYVGITTGNTVSDDSDFGARFGNETRVKNVAVIFAIKYAN